MACFRAASEDDIRRSVKYLRGGGTPGYAPDQDMRSKDSVFVPFFGVPAATITATHHLARLSGARVIPFHHRRAPMRLGAPLEAFPSTDVLNDTARVNVCIEDMVRGAPEQYLWTSLSKRILKAAPRSTDLPQIGDGLF